MNRSFPQPPPINSKDLSAVIHKEPVTGEIDGDSIRMVVEVESCPPLVMKILEWHLEKLA